MSILQRMMRVWRAVLGSGVAKLEVVHAAELLDLERHELCLSVANYNRGLAGYAALAERTKAELRKSEYETRQLYERLEACLTAGDRSLAGRHALRIEQHQKQAHALNAQFEHAETSYAELLRARELAVTAARDKLDALQRGIEELVAQESLARLSEFASGMQGSVERGGSNAQRLLERVEQRRHLAVGRVRVARSDMQAEGLQLREAEWRALGEQALLRLQAGRAGCA